MPDHHHPDVADAPAPDALHTVVVETPRGTETYVFNLGPPTAGQLLDLAREASVLHQPFEPPGTHAEADRWLRDARHSRTRMSLDERIALRRALDQRPQEATEAERPA